MSRGLPGRYYREEDLRGMYGTIEYAPSAKYSYAAGHTISTFLDGLKNGKILGRRCAKCNRILVPPRPYCEFCARPAGEWIEIPGVGRVETAVVSYISAKRGRLEEPEIVGVIRFDVPGVNEGDPDFPGMFHRLCGISPEDVMSGRAIGMMVRPRWKPPELRSGSVLDIECFEPTGEAP